MTFAELLPRTFPHTYKTWWSRVKVYASPYNDRFFGPEWTISYVDTGSMSHVRQSASGPTIEIAAREVLKQLLDDDQFTDPKIMGLAVCNNDWEVTHPEDPLTWEQHVRELLDLPS